MKKNVVISISCSIAILFVITNKVMAKEKEPELRLNASIENIYLVSLGLLDASDIFQSTNRIRYRLRINYNRPEKSMDVKRRTGFACITDYACPGIMCLQVKTETDCPPWAGSPQCTKPPGQPPCGNGQ